MIVMVIIAVLLAVGVPSFRDATLGSKLSGYANSLVASVRTARSEAIKRNATVSVCMSTNGTSCATAGTWEQGWIVMCPTSDSLVCDSSGTGTLVITHQQALPSGFKVTEASSTSTIAFKPMGISSTSYVFTVCRSDPVGTQERVVNVYSTGRTSVSRTTNGICL